MNPKLYQWLIGCFAAVGSFTFGYDLGVIAEILPALQGIDGFSPDSNTQGLITSLLSVGAFCGAFFASWLADIIGRRGTILAATVLFCFGAALQCGCRNNGFLMGGRFVTGGGIGIYCMIVPLYQAEIAHPSVRGYLTALQQLFLGIGGLTSSWIGYGCYVHLTGEARFRLPLGLQIAPAAVLGCFIYMFPESPRYLMQRDRRDEALQTLAYLHAHGDIHNPMVLSQIAEISEHMAAARSMGNPWKEMVATKANRRRLFIGITIQAATQMTGGSAISYFLPEIYDLMGFSTSRSLPLNSISSIIALVGEISCMLLVDRLGRRWPLIIGSVVMSVTFIIGAVLMVKYPADQLNNAAHWGFTVVTWVFSFTYASTTGTISWVYPSEIFSNTSRSKSVAVTTMMSFAFSTFVSQVTPIALKNIGWRYYILYVVCNLTNALTFWALFPETSGIPLEEMDNLFAESPIFVPLSNWTPTADGHKTELEVRTEKHEAMMAQNVAHEN
ncbi:MAG: hypothetical protein STHCBS139747_003877 [Sporothrix thermara]